MVTVNSTPNASDLANEEPSVADKMEALYDPTYRLTAFPWPPFASVEFGLLDDGISWEINDTGDFYNHCKQCRGFHRTIASPARHCPWCGHPVDKEKATYTPDDSTGPAIKKACKLSASVLPPIEVCLAEFLFQNDSPALRDVVRKAMKKNTTEPLPV